MIFKPLRCRAYMDKRHALQRLVQQPDHENNFVQTSFKLTSPRRTLMLRNTISATMNDGWFVTAMPDLNQKNPHVYRYLVQNSFWWIEYADIDGIRMDTYPYADMMP